MHMLFIRYHAREEGYGFTSSEEAYKALSDLNAKVGKKWYGKNGDEESPTYILKTPSGEAAICLEKVESIYVVDAVKDNELADQIFDIALCHSTQRKVKQRKSEHEAGLSGLPAA